MAKMTVNISIRAHPKDTNTFELLIATAVLKTQLLLPRAMLNRLRIMIEKALTAK